MVGDVPFHLKLALSDPPPFEKRQLRPMSAYNVSELLVVVPVQQLADKTVSIDLSCVEWDIELGYLSFSLLLYMCVVTL